MVNILLDVFCNNFNIHIFRCPLYSDTQKLHQEAVIKGAEQAKVEIGVADDPKKLKIDPTADLYQHYKCRKHDAHIHQPRPPHLVS